MSYLRRRIERLLDDLESGKTKLTPQVAEQLAPELGQIRRSENGTLILESCSKKLRAFARAYYGAAKHLTAEDASDPEPSQHGAPPAHDPTELNRTLFYLHAELFEKVTGVPPERFVPPGSSFDKEIRQLGAKYAADRKAAERMLRDANDANERLATHYERMQSIRLSTAAKLPGLKAVLGGQQSFTGAGVAAVRSTILYCDTILIPDPVLRWFEREDSGERFNHVLMLEDIYHLSQLKPLVEADRPDLPLLVFPSWEKVLEQGDVETQDGIELLAISVFGKALSATFDDLEEVRAFALENQDTFLRAIDRHHLFVAQGGTPGAPLAGELNAYKADVQRWRSPEHFAQLSGLSDAEVVLVAIMERLVPQFHALDNAENLHAQPLYSLPVQWHYFQTCFSLEAEQLAAKKVLATKTLRALRGLTGESAAWLANIPLQDVVRLRQDMATMSFRKNLSSILSELDDITDSNLDTSLSNVAQALSKLLADHQVEVRRIDEEYQRRHAQTLAGLAVGVGAAFLPWLPTFAAVAAGTAAIGKWTVDSVDKLLRKRQLGRTMMGVLAASARSKRG